MTRWERLCAALSLLEREEPGLEGLRWPLYLLGSGRMLGSGPLVGTVTQAARWLKAHAPHRRLPSTSVWYAIHGRSPAHELPFLAVHRELARRGTSGTLLGPYPYSKLELATGWEQLSIVGGPTALDPAAFLKIRRRARDLCGPVASALREVPDLLPDPLDPAALEPLVWRTLALDQEMAMLVEQYRPRVVLVGIDLGPIRNPLVRHARAAGAYTLVLQHGLQGEYTGTVAAEEVSLWGEYHRKVTLRYGAPAPALVVDGSPRMDLTLAEVHNSATRMAARKQLGIGEDEPVVLHLLDNMGVLRRHYPAAEEWFREEASRAFSLLSRRVRLLVRPHPSDSDRDWDYLRDSGCQLVEPKFLSLTKTIAAADVVSTMISTAGLEALWCGRPLVFFRPQMDLPTGELIDLGAGPVEHGAEGYAMRMAALASDLLIRTEALKAASPFCCQSLAYRGTGARHVADRVGAHL